MAKTTKKLSPRKARNIDDICLLQRDNIRAGDFWILTDSGQVSICQQTPGEGPKQSIDVPRKTFDRMVDWYMREQNLRRP